MRAINFTVPGPPKGKQRPRVVRRGGKSITYTPKETVAAEQAVRFYFEGEAPPNWKAWEGPVRVEILAYFQHPQSWPKWKRELGEFQYATCRPDVDNILKLVCDALNGVAWKDDRQVVVALTIKCWTTGEPCTIVELRFLDAPTRKKEAEDGQA